MALFERYLKFIFVGCPGATLLSSGIIAGVLSIPAKRY